MAGMRDRTLLVGSLTVLAAAAGFGILGPVARFAYEAGLEPFSFIAWRAAFGALVVIIYAAWRLKRGRRAVAPWRLAGGERAALGIAALMALTLNVAMFFAFDRATVALVLLGFYTYPALVAIVAVARGDEPLDSVRGAALALSLAGMVLVVAGGLDPGGGVRVDLLGIGLALFAAVSQTVFISVSRIGYRSMPTEQAMGWILASTAIASAILAVAAGAGSQLTSPLRSGDPLALSVLAGVLGAGIPSLLFLTGIRTIGGTRTGILMLFEPVVGVVLAAILLGEALLAIQAVGGLAILGAALLLQRSRPGARAAEPAAHEVPPSSPPIPRGAER
jgi:drug/metabolite transporter (DMT)-like permease